MFDLTPKDLSGSILDCAGGPASFNAEGTRKGYRIVSCDPIYRFTANEISARVDAMYDRLIKNVAARRDGFVWDGFGSPQRLGEARMEAMRRFLGDFPAGLEEGRYQSDGLPHLHFADQEFDLILCSHFLFTYSEQLSPDFHVSAIEEMCRVGREVRIFPLLKSYGGRSPHVEGVIRAFRRKGYRTEVEAVPYEFQRGGNELLSVARG